ncbi:MAG: DUF4115 domain-containing protein [Ignavibacteriales bacterium]|nr:DUF4115 domain-containing protein [Ignavibacteriales bacterium]
MNETGAKLKQAREERGLSLDEVSQATRINKKFLQAIEEGKSVELPELYVHSFIKDYAEYIGIELTDSPTKSKPEQSSSGRISSTISSQVTTTNLPGSSAMKYPQILKPRRSHQFRILLLITFVVLLMFAALIYWKTMVKENPSVQEVKFSDVVNEWEKKETSDSVVSPFLSDSTDSNFALDSLVLEGAAVESVWVRIVIDGSEIKEQTLPPLGRIRCEGRQYFELSTDNARGIVLTFNGERIGILSQIKKPMWNVTISPGTLEKLQKMSSGKL